MSSEIQRQWSATTDTDGIEVVCYDDGDVTIKNDGKWFDGIQTAFVLSPDQVEKFLTRARLIQTESESITWTIGQNCTGSGFFLRYDADAEETPYALGNGDDWLNFSQSTLNTLRELLAKKHSAPTP